MNEMARTIVFAAWSVFIVYWLVSAIKRKPTVKRESVVSHLIVVLVVGIGSQMLFTSIVANVPQRRVLPQSVVLDLLACAAAIGGLGLAIWARRTIGENWSASITLKEHHELVQAGPYRFVRHPIYTGFLLMVLGTALVPARTRGFLGFLLNVAGFWYKWRQEEKLMIATFPNEYPAYKSRVKAIVPWVL